MTERSSRRGATPAATATSAPHDDAGTVVPAGALRNGQASVSAEAAQARLNGLAQVRHASTSRKAPQPMLYDALRASHEVQRALCRQIVRIPGSQPAKRLAVFKSLKLELAAHAAAEERYLYVPMLMDDAGLDPSRHALHEHHQMDEMVEDIEGLAPDGEAWMTHVKELAHKVRHHLKEEEHKFFQASGKILSEAQKLKAGRAYLRDHARMLGVLAGG